jgi:hypothetical protein
MRCGLAGAGLIAGSRYRTPRNTSSNGNRKTFHREGCEGTRWTAPSFKEFQGL